MEKTTRGTGKKKALFMLALAAVLLGSAPCSLQAETAAQTAVSSQGAQPVTPLATGLRLNKTNLRIRKGRIYHLKAVITPSSAAKTGLKWTSSNKQVATVDSKGTVKARHKGECVITVTTADGRLKASCEMIVRLVPETVTLNKTSLTLYEKDRYQLKATVKPKNASSVRVLWKSSNPDIVSVSKKGKIHAKKTGTVTITATTSMGLRTASCKVTVKQGSHWETANGRMRYVDHGKVLTGYSRIGKFYYLFDSNGYAQKGLVFSGGKTYYIRDSNYRITQIKVGSSYYNADGSPRDFSLGYDIDAYYYAKMYVEKLTTPSMSMSEKLYTCFMWAASFPYLDTREFYYQKDWVPLFAFDCFLGHGGPCYSNANAFAYMAKAIGYKNVYCCLDSATDADNAHGWAEVDGLCYDPLFYRAKGSQYYALPYSGWNEWPEVKVKLS